MDNVSIQWIADRAPEDKDKFKELIFNNNKNPVLQRLRDIIVNKRTALEASERDSKIYDNANWSHKQAHNNGARQALKQIEDLLSFVV